MKGKVPKLSLHSTGQYFIKFQGKNYYLGKDEFEAEKKRIQILSEFFADSGDELDPKIRDDILLTVEDVALKFLESIEERRKKTNSYIDPLSACKTLIELSGSIPIKKFHKKNFMEVRDFMREKGWALRTARIRLQYVKKVFEYAYNMDFISSEQYGEIKLMRGYSQEEFEPTEEVTPVDIEDVMKTLPYLPPMVADMVLLQFYTGTRANEVCTLQWGEINKDKEVWFYCPKKHKTRHWGKKRIIYIGPKAQEILKKYEGIPDDEYIFNPAKSREDRYKAMRAARKTKVQPSQQDRKKDNPKKVPGNKYTSMSYGQCISRGCTKAMKEGVIKSKWHSHQLRHSAATVARAIAGLDGAQVYLGHSSAKMTERYAEIDTSLGEEIAKKIG